MVVFALVENELPNELIGLVTHVVLNVRTAEQPAQTKGFHSPHIVQPPVASLSAVSRHSRRSDTAPLAACPVIHHAS